MTDEIRQIGPRIKMYRKMYGLTQDQLAEAIGLDTGYLASIERGRRSLALPKLIELCKFFGITLDDLIALTSGGGHEDTKNRWIDDICLILRELDYRQVGMIRLLLEHLPKAPKK